MIQKIKNITGLLVVVDLVVVFALVGNSINMLYAQDQVTTTTTFSDKGTIIPFSVINPKTGEYTLAGTWTMDINEGKVTNFIAEMQVEGHPVTHQLMNFRQAADEVFELDADNSGEIRGTADMMHDNNIAHRNVSTNITIDRGVVISVTLDIVDLGYPINPTIYGLTDS